MKLKSVKLCFENCEDLTYEYPSFCYFNIEGYGVSFGNYSNGTYKNESIKGFTMIIAGNAIPSDSCLFSERSDQNTRLMNDITQLILIYEDGSSDHFNVTWPDDDDDQYHSLQTVRKTEKGNYLIHSMVEGMKECNFSDEEIDFTVEFKKV